jgi:hypothetical protein
MSGVAGRFLGRDPIGYIDGESLYRSYLSMNQLDPIGNRIQGPRAPRRREGWRHAYHTEVDRCVAISFGTDCLWSCRVMIKEMIEVTDRDGDTQLLMGIFPPYEAQRTIPAPQDACTCPAEYRASGGGPPRSYVDYGPFIPIELFPIPPNNGPAEYV